MRLQMEESREKRKVGALQGQNTSNILMNHILS